MGFLSELILTEQLKIRRPDDCLETNFVKHSVKGYSFFTSIPSTPLFPQQNSLTPKSFHPRVLVFPNTLETYVFLKYINVTFIRNLNWSEKWGKIIEVQ